MKTTSTHSSRHDLPAYIADIKKEVGEKIARSPLIIGCRQGDRRFLKALVLGFWPFVAVFPEIIHRQYSALPSEKLGKMARVLERAARLAGAGTSGFAGLFSEMQKDEESHKELWTFTADALGIDLQQELGSGKPLHEAQDLIDLVDSKVGFFTTFLRFGAVEMVAETLSKNLLSSEAFASVLTERGKIWFKVHIAHAGTTHEEVTFRAAFACYGAIPDMREVNRVVQETVDAFIRAGDACCAQWTS